MWPTAGGQELRRLDAGAPFSASERGFFSGAASYSVPEYKWSFGPGSFHTVHFRRIEPGQVVSQVGAE